MNGGTDTGRQSVGRERKGDLSPIFYFLNNTQIILPRQAECSTNPYISPHLSRGSKHYLRPIRPFQTPRQSLPRRRPSA